MTIVLERSNRCRAALRCWRLRRSKSLSAAYSFRSDRLEAGNFERNVRVECPFAKSEDGGC